jgi:hypothetical protein
MRTVPSTKKISNENCEQKYAIKKSAISGGFSRNSALIFYSTLLPLLLRRWVGIAKVKIKWEARKNHFWMPSQDLLKFWCR